MIRKYLEMIRFSHTLFALPFALLAVVWAIVYPFPDGTDSYAMSGQRWLGVLLCMVFARSFAMAVNRWADAEMDGKNPPHRQSPYPFGTTLFPIGGLVRGPLWSPIRGQLRAIPPEYMAACFERPGPAVLGWL